MIVIDAVFDMIV